MRDLFQFELMLPTGGSYFGSYGGGNAINDQFNMIDKGIRRGIDSIRLDRWGDDGGSSGNSGSGGGNTSNNCRDSTEVVTTKTTTTTTTSPGFTFSTTPPFLHVSIGRPVTTTTNSASVTRKIICEK